VILRFENQSFRPYIIIKIPNIQDILWLVRNYKQMNIIEILIQIVKI